MPRKRRFHDSRHPAAPNSEPKRLESEPGALPTQSESGASEAGATSAPDDNQKNDARNRA